jgi:alkylated DNA repair dioxygenase AlkB
MDGLLTDLLPQIESASGLALFPTYSYFRVYRHGDTLAKHIDRASCEVSVSLCLGCEGDKSWPILIEGPQGPSSIILGAGDALLYRGMECPHWREIFEGQRQAQVFLHYVDKNGPYTEWKFDERTSTALLAPSNLQHKRV